MQIEFVIDMFDFVRDSLEGFILINLLHFEPKMIHISVE